MSILATILPIAPETEYLFHEPVDGEKRRKWRFDFAYPEFKIAIEIEGGIWVGGRHIHPVGFEKDCEKYNEAVALGWKIFRIPPKLISEDYFRHLLRNINCN